MTADQITTNDIDLCAAIKTLTNERLTLSPGRDLVDISFRATPETRLIAQKFATGELDVPVRLFATNRNTLFRYIREVAKLCREVSL